MSDRALEGHEWGDALLDEYEVPSHLRPGLERYIKDGIRPGGFLSAIIANDLREAVLRAATVATFESILGIVKFLCFECPDPSHGSPEKFEAWINRKRTITPSTETLA